jgi:23S rRNA pseudouridine1911/1915/1917 synthase
MSAQIIKLLVPEEADGDRLDRFLADSLPQYSREYLKTLVLGENIQLESGKTLSKPSYTISEGQEFILTIPEPTALTLEPEPLPLDVVYEDDDVLVVNKDSGILTHPTGKEQRGTLVNALLYHCHGQLSGINGVERPGIVHRLDRDTSGLLMVAKTDLAHKGLQEQLHARTAKRRYRAIVQGMMPELTGTVNAPIDRNPKKREKMAVIETGREAITHWEVIDTIGDKFSIVHLKLETGRTHQIRVHMAHIGHPIFADPLYGTGLETQMPYRAEGQILQAFQLAFQHPRSKELLSFEIPADEKFERTQIFLLQWIN